MIRTYNFTFLDCQSCPAHSHCEQCRDELQQRLMHMSGISAAEIDINAKRLTIETDLQDPWDLEELLENAGIFV